MPDHLAGGVSNQGPIAATFRPPELLCINAVFVLADRMGAVCGNAFDSEIDRGIDMHETLRPDVTAAMSWTVILLPRPGDWGGSRKRLKEKGAELDLKCTQFFRGVTSGGTETGSEYNGKLRGVAKFDLGKLAGWDLWHAEIGTEMRHGGPQNGHVIRMAARLDRTDIVLTCRSLILMEG